MRELVRVLSELLDLAIVLAFAITTVLVFLGLAVIADAIWCWWAERNRIRWDGTHWVTEHAATVTGLDDARRAREARQ